ncbi:putative 3-oxoacyl-[acyl-carrier-protein] synthase III [Kitasatospora setae KM-6054]|uniref:Putative 3-oxoacyl-[acyl-carrier-protein] synthase III n=1 Tax=Kitasatospora setae (strain ATCC 33774 / DSM 43861 / JCM 3304 / KCC A-0304 / NBRC 14216 / KM-6054) TaxID=452652 RepID=E4N2C6_KITSK|nr:putative 3-oxoacyl-[acyl-carrier-protein] synthase III [Kitasatospora setae KM-6054]
MGAPGTANDLANDLADDPADGPADDPGTLRAPGVLRAAAPVAGARILGVGGYRPTRVVGNEEVAGPIDSSDEWIRRRSGIAARRFAGPDESLVTMAAAAAVKALAHAGVAPENVDTLLLATMSHLEQSPPAAPRVAHLVGATHAGAVDLGAACAGFCHALALADGLVRSGHSRYVVVVGAERMSDLIDPADRGTAFLFGDGAGAVVVGPAARPGIGPVVWGADGSRPGAIAHAHGWRDLRSADPPPWPTLRMEGPAVFRWAVETVPRVGREALAAAGVAPEDLAAFVPHQANLRIVDAAADALKLPASVAVARDVVDTGNTSAASVPLALERLLSEGAAGPGGLALLVGFGAGLSFAGQVVELP